jgi:hypothetical protein
MFFFSSTPTLNPVSVLEGHARLDIEGDVIVVEAGPRLPSLRIEPSDSHGWVPPFFWDMASS